MTTIIHPCGCSEGADQYGGRALDECPLHDTPPEDEPEEQEEE
jgi:hypothetical protein